MLFYIVDANYKLLMYEDIDNINSVFIIVTNKVKVFRVIGKCISITPLNMTVLSTYSF